MLIAFILHFCLSQRRFPKIDAARWKIYPIDSESYNKIMSFQRKGRKKYVHFDT